MNNCRGYDPFLDEFLCHFCMAVPFRSNVFFCVSGLDLYGTHVEYVN